MPPLNHSQQQPPTTTGHGGPKQPDLPTFPSLLEVKRSIPARCFESSAKVSMLYALRSLALILALGYLLHLSASVPLLATSLGRAAVLTTYWLAQGTVLWGVFTLGHDCGHGAFSKYRRLNQIMGLVLHTPLLVPYDSWRITHRHHHKNTGNLEKDEVFFPHREGQETNSTKKGRRLPAILGLSWFTYLRTGFPPRYTAHFNEADPMWGNERPLVHVSLLSAYAWVGLVALAAVWAGPAAVFHYYLMPLVVYSSWLVVTTFLHHTDPNVPWYADAEWDYVKGNLSTVDRSYGALVDNIAHHIGTHQVHHLFPAIPHYHLEEATVHFRKAYPHLVRVSNERIAFTFYRMVRMYARYGGSCPDNAKVFRYADAISKEQQQQQQQKQSAN